ncbi:hypothetical protein ABIB90_007243, partial [Bradyrhizobium sp. JR4.1]
RCDDEAENRGVRRALTVNWKDQRAAAYRVGLRRKRDSSGCNDGTLEIRDLI